APHPVGTERLRIGPGLRVVVYLWVTVDVVPPKLSHNVTVQMAGDSDELTVTELRSPVSSAAPRLIAAPMLSQRAFSPPSTPSAQELRRRPSLRDRAPPRATHASRQGKPLPCLAPPAPTFPPRRSHRRPTSWRTDAGRTVPAIVAYAPE